MWARRRGGHPPKWAHLADFSHHEAGLVDAKCIGRIQGMVNAFVAVMIKGADGRVVGEWERPDDPLVGGGSLG